MFGNVTEMFQYVEKLQEAKKQYMQHKFEELNNKCEACKEKEIEIEYRYPNYSEEVRTETGVKLIINNHLFCIPCYKTIIETGQLERSHWMIEDDKEIFGEE